MKDKKNAGPNTYFAGIYIRPIIRAEKCSIENNSFSTNNLVINFPICRMLFQLLFGLVLHFLSCIFRGPISDSYHHHHHHQCYFRQKKAHIKYRKKANRESTEREMAMERITKCFCMGRWGAHNAPRAGPHAVGWGEGHPRQGIRINFVITAIGLTQFLIDDATY